MDKVNVTRNRPKIKVCQKRPREDKVCASQSSCSYEPVVLKAMLNSVYQDLLNDDPNAEECSVRRRDIQAKAIDKDYTPMEAEIPYICNFCNTATFSDPEECYKHAGSCVFNPREDPFVKGGIVPLVPPKAAKKKP